jgi:hypothetical protein
MRAKLGEGRERVPADAADHLEDLDGLGFRRRDVDRLGHCPTRHDAFVWPWSLLPRVDGSETARAAAALHAGHEGTPARLTAIGLPQRLQLPFSGTQ